MNTEADIADSTRTYPVRVLRVIDGDTWQVSVSVGFYADVRVTIRLLGIDCPEMHGEDAKRGQAAKAYVKALIEKRGPWMMAHIAGRDAFGRWLAHVEIPGANGLTINTDLLVQKHAVPFKQ